MDIARKHVVLTWILFAPAHLWKNRLPSSCAATLPLSSNDMYHGWPWPHRALYPVAASRSEWSTWSRRCEVEGMVKGRNMRDYRSWLTWINCGISVNQIKILIAIRELTELPNIDREEMEIAGGRRERKHYVAIKEMDERAMERIDYRRKKLCGN